MSLFNIFSTKTVEQIEPKNDVPNDYHANWSPVRSVSFDGEKTAGELGNPINIYPEHESLRLRAFEADLKSDVIKIISGKFFKWVIGAGLKLQAQPNEKVLKSEGIFEDFTDFRSLTEARFEVFSDSKFSDYSGMVNLHKKANDAYKSAFLGGDCLVILRLDETLNVTVQVIDGQEVSSPFFDTKWHNLAKEKGNRIVHGIEIGKRGEHIAFFVRKAGGTYLMEHERIEAKSLQTGRLMAWMIYGNKHRLNHHRGIPQITQILEKVEKLDRYTEASVAGAEERAKIVYAIEHNRFSTGESPVIANIQKSLGVSVEDDPYMLGAALEKKITASTEKQTFNLPIGAKLSTLAGNQESQYGTFFEAVFMQLAASMDCPPEVALQKYSSNYSASRAAINGWGYLIDIYRKDFSYNFYRNVYDLWLEVEILKNKIKAPGYLKAIHDNNHMAIESYSASKFTGSNMPHIDPKKEIEAVRRMLGDKTKGEASLISHEQAAESLNLGEWSDNYLKFQEEEKGIDPIINPNTPIENDSNNKNKE